jgi:hypothetical protein
LIPQGYIAGGGQRHDVPIAEPFGGEVSEPHPIRQLGRVARRSHVRRVLRFSPGMDTWTIVSLCVAACVTAVAAFVAHGRLAGTGERAGCSSMVAFVIGWLAVLTALITGVFLLSLRPVSG